MNRVFFLKVSLLVALLAAVSLSVQLVWLRQQDMAAQQRFAEKVNLALRRTAHLLLREAGDTSSRIPAVQQVSATTWSIRLERAFDYQKLPAFLHQSLEVHQLASSYDVALRTCSDHVLQLGYNFLDFTRSPEVPCQERAFEPGCYNLRLSFSMPQPAHDRSVTGLIASLLLAVFLALVWYLTSQPRRPAALVTDPPAAVQALYFGHSALDHANQTLRSGETSYNLTYREAKLLQLLASHPNQVLERDFILKSVWEDEGIIVGRSLDVFVSRLRKVLRTDPTVKLVAVHGVGYRLEVAQQPVQMN